MSNNLLPRHCGLCHNYDPNLKICSKCKSIGYCTKEHQTVHWSQHKEVCKQTVTSRVMFEQLASMGVPEDSFQHWYNLRNSRNIEKRKEANFHLGIRYEAGYGVNINTIEAIKRFTIAAELGSCDAAYNLALIYSVGKDGLPVDEGRAFNLLRQIKDMKPLHREALHMLGRSYQYGKGVEVNIDQAIAYYEAAGGLGEPNALFELELLYRNGDDIEQDLIRALGYCQLAAEQGFASSQHNLGMHYLEGSIVERNITRAMEWFERAAEQGKLESQCHLAFHYYEEGESQNIDRAIKLFKNIARVEGFGAFHTLLGKIFLQRENIPNAFKHYCRGIENKEFVDQAKNYWNGTGGVVQNREYAILLIVQYTYLN